MKRIVSLILLLSLCIFSLASCAGQSEDGVPDGMLRAKSAQLDLWLFYPESWSVTQNGEVLKLASAEEVSLENQLSTSDVADGSASLPSNVANVSVFSLKEGVTDLAAYAEGEWRESFSDSYVFDVSFRDALHGADAMREYTYHLAGSEDQVLYRFSQRLILHDSTVYALIFAATPDLYELLLDSYGDVASSVTFETVSEEENTPLTSAPDAAVAEDAAKVAQKEGLSSLTNRGVDFILYYPGEGWHVLQDTGFLAIETDSGASVSVARGDAYAVQVQTPEEYLDGYYYPSFDAFYGGHEELSREQTSREDSLLLTVSYETEVEGEPFRFLQAMYWKNGYIYTLLYTAKSADYGLYLADVENMITEFEFK